MDSIDISFIFDNQLDQSLIKLWKLTKNDFVSSKFTSSQRLNNRTWRILNKKILLGSSKKSNMSEEDLNTPISIPDTLTPFPTISNTSNIDRSIGDLSRDSLTNLAPKLSQFLSERPSLFSHSSNLSLHSNRKSTNNSSLDSYNPKNCSENGKGGIPDSEEDEEDDDEDVYDDDDDISDISDILEEGEDDDENEDVSEVPEELISPSKSGAPDFSIDTSRPRAVSTITTSNDNSASSSGPPPLVRSRTSFVRGFSPSRGSISPISTYADKLLPMEQKDQRSIESAETAPPKPNKNIFYIANSPSPPSSNYKNDNKSKSSISKSPKSSPGSQTSEYVRSTRHSQPNPSTASRPSVTQPTIQRHNSLFSNFQMQFKKDETPKISPKVEEKIAPEEKDEGYSSTDISEDEDDDDGAYSEDEGADGQRELEFRQKDYSNNLSESKISQTHNHNNTTYNNSNKDLFIRGRDRGSSTTTQITTDNESEWLSVSSEDDDSKSAEEPKFGPLKFAKIPTLTKITSNSSISTDIVSNEQEEITNIQVELKRKPSLLNSKPKSLLSGLFLNELANQQGQLPQQTNQLIPKPILKRSSTTGIITFDQSKNDGKVKLNHTGLPGRSNGVSETSKRPYIMFTKKYNSSTDISKNYPHFQNNLVRQDILQDDEQSDKESETSKSKIANDNSTDSLLGKQKSIVGISDFNVTASSSSSGVNEVKDPKGPSNIKKTNPVESEYINSHTILSTSLNKLSGSVANHSIRSLLSKSSLNITKLYNNSKSMFGKGEDKLDSQSLRGTNLAETKSSEIAAPKSLPDANIIPNGLPAESQILSPKLGSPNSTSTPISTTPGKAIHGFPEVNGSMNDVYDGETILQEKKKAFKMSPKSTRRSMLSTELSKSLKESIIIDYRLGKIPLPKKVFAGDNQYELVAGENDVDDYHSKGW